MPGTLCNFKHVKCQLPVSVTKLNSASLPFWIRGHNGCCGLFEFAPQEGIVTSLGTGRCWDMHTISQIALPENSLLRKSKYITVTLEMPGIRFSSQFDPPWLSSTSSWSHEVACQCFGYFLFVFRGSARQCQGYQFLRWPTFVTKIAIQKFCQYSYRVYSKMRTW